MPRFTFDFALNGFQRMLKTLLECVASVHKRENIYESLLNRCNRSGLLVIRDSVIENLTVNEMHAFGVRLGKGSTIVKFTTMFQDKFLQLDDDEFMQRMVS